MSGIVAIYADMARTAISADSCRRHRLTRKTQIQRTQKPISLASILIWQHNSSLLTLICLISHANNSVQAWLKLWGINFLLHLLSVIFQVKLPETMLTSGISGLVHLQSTLFISTTFLTQLHYHRTPWPCTHSLHFCNHGCSPPKHGLSTKWSPSDWSLWRDFLWLSSRRMDCRKWN